MMRRLAFMLALAVCSCGDDIPTIDPNATGSGSGTDSGDSIGDAPTTMPPGDDTAGTTAGPEPMVVFEATLALETKRVVQIVLTQTGDDLQASVTPSEGFGVAAAGDALTGPARIDTFPEAGATIYTARLGGPAVADGRCGDAPVSLALALHLDADATFIAGGLTPYCGADTWFGVPVIEPLRISGTP
jgi:hypothetical protein